MGGCIKAFGGGGGSPFRVPVSRVPTAVNRCQLPSGRCVTASTCPTTAVPTARKLRRIPHTGWTMHSFVQLHVSAVQGRVHGVQRLTWHRAYRLHKGPRPTAPISSIALPSTLPHLPRQASPCAPFGPTLPPPRPPAIPIPFHQLCGDVPPSPFPSTAPFGQCLCQPWTAPSRVHCLGMTACEASAGVKRPQSTTAGHI